MMNTIKRFFKLLITFIKSLLSTYGKLSSKRFCGILGWFVLMACYAYATVNNIQLPEITTEFIFGDVCLLGVDSITSIWKKRAGVTEETTEEEKSKEEA